MKNIHECENLKQERINHPILTIEKVVPHDFWILQNSYKIPQIIIKYCPFCGIKLE